MTTNQAGKPKGIRLEYIDGLRGISAMLVICYHYFARWTPPKNPENLYPYGDVLYYFPLFHRAEYALMMLFVISGFVIMMTLERCRTPFEFLVRRFTRIWPALALCSLITFIVLSLLPNSPWQPSVLNFLPSLTTVDPLIFAYLFGLKGVDYMDGVYWTLWVDVKYYFLIALLYFGLGASFRKWLLVGGIVATVSYNLAVLVKLSAAAYLLKHLLLANFVPWFLIGIGFYFMHKDNAAWYEEPLLWVGVIGLEVQELVGGSVTRALLALIVPLIFYAAMRVPAATRFLSSRFFTTIGAASFGMYLLHQRIGVGFMHWLGSVVELSVLAGIAVAFAVAIMVTLVSMVLYDVYEQPLNRRLADAILRWKEGADLVLTRSWARVRN